jgi:UDP-N-acetylglucosamine pyrophosphorylase
MDTSTQNPSGFETSKYSCFSNIFFFKGTLPILSTDGNLLLETPSKLHEGPDGNGGVYGALARSGIFKRLRDDVGTLWLHIFG